MARSILSLLIAVVAVASLALAASASPARAGGGCHGAEPARLTDERRDTVLASNCAFLPAVVRIDAGRPLTFMNNDIAPHTFTGVASSFGDFNEYALGQSVTYTFEEPGLYPYFCALHPSMAGVVVVGDGASSQAQAGAAVRQVAGPAPVAGDGAAPGEAASDDGDGISATVAAVVVGIAGLLAGGVVGAAVTRRLLPR